MSEKTPYFDHDLEKETISLGKDITLKINPNGHLPDVTDKIVDIADKYDTFRLTNPSLKEGREKRKDATKEILELGLVEFDYVDASGKVGYALLDKIADFLLVYQTEHGGKEGFRVWQTQLNLMMKAPSSGTKD